MRLRKHAQQYEYRHAARTLYSYVYEDRIARGRSPGRQYFLLESEGTEDPTYLATWLPATWQSLGSVMLQHPTVLLLPSGYACHKPGLRRM